VAKRTLKDARYTLEQVVGPGLNNLVLSEYEHILEQAEQQAHQVADDRVEQMERQVKEIRDDSLRELADVRDEAEQLNRDLQLGHEPVATYTQKLHALRTRKEIAGNLLAKAEELVDQAQEIEEDPVRHFDDLATRFPHMRPEVPW